MAVEGRLVTQDAEHLVQADRHAWLRATRVRHAALAMAALEVAEAIRELKEGIAELRQGSGNSEQ